MTEGLQRGFNLDRVLTPARSSLVRRPSRWSSSRRGIELSLLLAFIESRIVSGIIPGHHQVLERFILYCNTRQHESAGLEQKLVDESSL